MSTSRQQLKGYFAHGSKPTAAQFGALIDSYRHVDEPVPLESIGGIKVLLNHIHDIEAGRAAIEGLFHQSMQQTNGLLRYLDELDLRLRDVERIVAALTAPPLTPDI